MISEKMVYQYSDNEKETYRVIYIDYENNLLHIVKLEGNSVMPKNKKISFLEEQLESEIIYQIPDPYLKIYDENKLSKIEKEKRDFNWNIIQKYWMRRKDEILNKSTRNKIFSVISNEYNLSIPSIKRLFTRFWQRGMVPNSLLPDYSNSGGRGKEKKLKSYKIGRPKNTDYYGNKKEGINITDDIKKLFKQCLNKYYYTKQKKSLTETYNYLLRDYFSEKYNKDGERKYIIWDQDRIPTYRQFYYWFMKNKNLRLDIISRENSKDYDLKHRPILNNSTIETEGPGSRFQVDATVADIYLVSSLNRNRIISRPVVYAIIDVFSRLVTGIYVGLEGPSWIGAMMALDNMVSNKVDFCKNYDINISEYEWPSKHLPEVIIADRGEFEGYSVENLIKNLNVKIENTAPYRGDLKGIVERKFRTINEKIKHKSPGAIQKEYRKRGDADYRLNAILTLKEFTQILIQLVLHHNKSVINNYPLKKEMIMDELLPTPLNLWDWGIKNLKGRLNIVDRSTFRLNILPRGKASISRRGIKFNNLFYTTERMISEQWYIKANHRSIEIIFDPRDLSHIYIPLTNNEYEEANLLDVSSQYLGLVYEEIIFTQELSREVMELNTNNQNQLNVDLEMEIDKINKNAKEIIKSEKMSTESKTKRLKGIRNNRSKEKEFNRIAESFKITENQPTISPKPESEDLKSSSNYDEYLYELIINERDDKLGDK